MKFDKLVLVGIFIIFGLIASPLPTSAAPTNNSADIIAEMNRERASRGLSQLRVDSALTRAAQNRSVYLANAGRIFHVTAPDGTPWPELAQAGYVYSIAGENLALGIETPAELSTRWMASPTHRDNILTSAYEDVGVGVTYGTHQGYNVSYVVVYFGKKQASATPTTPTTPTNTAKPTPAPAQATQSTQSVALVRQASNTTPSSVPARVATADTTRTQAPKTTTSPKPISTHTKATVAADTVVQTQTVDSVTESTVVASEPIVSPTLESTFVASSTLHKGKMNLFDKIISIFSSYVMFVRTNLALL